MGQTKPTTYHQTSLLCIVFRRSGYLERREKRRLNILFSVFLYIILLCWCVYEKWESGCGRTGDEVRPYLPGDPGRHYLTEKAAGRIPAPVLGVSHCSQSAAVWLWRLDHVGQLAQQETPCRLCNKLCPLLCSPSLLGLRSPGWTGRHYKVSQYNQPDKSNSGENITLGFSRPSAMSGSWINWASQKL